MCLDPHVVVISVESARFIGWVIFLALTGVVLLALDPVNPARKPPWPPKK